MILTAIKKLQCNVVQKISGPTNTLKKVHSPMYNNHVIKIHKGIDTPLYFKVVNLDYRPIHVQHTYYRARIYDNTNNKVFDKQACPIHDKKGYLQLDVLSHELANISPGLYTMVLTEDADTSYEEKMNIDVHAQGLYVDESMNLTYEVEITDQAIMEPRSSVETKPNEWRGDFLKNYSFDSAFVSEALPGSVKRSSMNEMNTVAVKGENFSGKLYFYGSLEDTPPSDIKDFFPLIVSPSGNNIEFENFTGIEAWNFESTLNWIRIQMVPSQTPQNTGELSYLWLR